MPQLSNATLQSTTVNRSYGEARNVCNSETREHVMQQKSAQSRMKPSNRPSFPDGELTLSREEFQTLTMGCLCYLQAHADCNALAVSVSDARTFAMYLVTATLCLSLAPRSQILRQLQVDTSLVKTNDQYWIKLPAESSKNNRPVILPVAKQLTHAYDRYLAVARPTLLKELLASSVQDHGYVFVKRSGHAPRPEFSSMTTVVTSTILGKPINAHAFRAAVITTFYENGASQSQMDTLATLMAHDPSTARAFYYRPQYTEAALLATAQMTKLLLTDTCHDQAMPSQQSNEPHLIEPLSMPVPNYVLPSLYSSESC